MGRIETNFKRNKMKKNIIIIGILASVIFTSCDPRIEMDMSQWGDHAIITNVQIFKYEVDNDPAIYEQWHELDAFGLRRVIISNIATVDLGNSTVTVALIANETLNEAGLILFSRKC